MLEDIRRPVAGEFAEYEEFLRSSLAADNELLNNIVEYVLSARGKGIRPLLVLLCARLCSARPAEASGKRTLLAAMLIEMLHTASLIHDDVIDDSDMRRGRPSVNALWQTRNAVLAGDYLLARSYSRGMESGQFDIVSYINRAMSELCEGEIWQNDFNKRLEMTRSEYNRIIFKKTATLIGTSCGVGALAVHAGRERVDLLRMMGNDMGMAFQIKDDILDYTASATDTGKPANSDLRSRKITLPLLTVLEKSTPARRRELLEMLSEAGDEGVAESLCRTVIEEGGTQMAEEVMKGYLDRAAKALAGFGPSPSRDSLVLLCAYLAGREK